MTKQVLWVIEAKSRSTGAWLPVAGESTRINARREQDKKRAFYAWTRIAKYIREAA